MQVTAPPVEGAANAAVGDLLAKWLGVPRRSITIAGGHGGRDKVVMIAADDPAGLGAFVDAALAGLE